MQETWGKVVQLVREQISKPSFETWIKNLEATQEGNHWTITTLNEFSKDWVENKYRSIIIDAIERVTGEMPDVMIVTKDHGDMFPPVSSYDFIWRQIQQLPLPEKEKLYNMLSKEMNNEHSRGGSQETSRLSVHKEKANDTDRMNRLELEIIDLKGQLQKIKDTLEHKLV